MANVLLVDHQPDRLRSYQSMLSDLEENLISASSGYEAVSRLDEAEFAVILLEVSLPDLDGFQTADLIHSHPRHEKTPIIFLASMHTPDLDQTRSRRLEPIEFLFAPVVPQVLRGKVAVLCELQGQRQRLTEDQLSTDRGARTTDDSPGELASGDKAHSTVSQSLPRSEGIDPCSRKIMLIDDNRDAVDMLSMALGLGQHDVQVVYDPLHAAEACERFRPDVIFMDLSMPGMSGYELAPQLRSATWSDRTLIVALTGWGDVTDRRRSSEAGFDHHLVKPADFDEIEKLCAARRRPGGGVQFETDDA